MNIHRMPDSRSSVDWKWFKTSSTQADPRGNRGNHAVSVPTVRNGWGVICCRGSPGCVTRRRDRG